LQAASCQQPPTGTSYITTNQFDQLNQLVRKELPIDGTLTTPTSCIGPATSTKT